MFRGLKTKKKIRISLIKYHSTYLVKLLNKKSLQPLTEYFVRKILLLLEKNRDCLLRGILQEEMLRETIRNLKRKLQFLYLSSKRKMRLQER